MSNYRLVFPADGRSGSFSPKIRSRYRGVFPCCLRPIVRRGEATVGQRAHRVLLMTFKQCHERSSGLDGTMTTTSSGNGYMRYRTAARPSTGYSVPSAERCAHTRPQGRRGKTCGTFNQISQLAFYATIYLLLSLFFSFHHFYRQQRSTLVSFVCAFASFFVAAISFTTDTSRK